MAAGYNTSNPQDIDFMYHLPTELMMRAITNADAQNDSLNQQLALFGDTAGKIQYLEPDRLRANEIGNQYKQQVNQLATELSQNPQDWRKKMSNIRDLGRQLTNDLSTGELAGIQSNYTKYQSWLKGETDRFNKGDITADWLNAAKTKYLTDYKGVQYDPQLGLGQGITVNQLAKHVDLNERFDKYLKEVKANTTEQKGTGVNGMYLIQTERGQESVTAERLKEIAAAKLAADDEVLAYMRQGSQLGVIKDPIKTLSSAMGAAVGTYAYSKIKTGQDIKENGVATNLYNQSQQNNRQEDSQQHDKDMIDVNYQDWLRKQKVQEKHQERMQKLGHNLKLSTKEVSLDDPQSIDTNPTTGTSTQTLSVFDKDELIPDYLRTEILPVVNRDIATKDGLINAAKQAGDSVRMNNLIGERQILLSQKNTAEGIINQSTQQYLSSPVFTSLPDYVKKDVQDYRTYLTTRGLHDNSQSRQAFASQTMGQYGQRIDFRERDLIPGKQARTSWEQFNKAVDKGVDFMTKYAQNTAISNKYNATGIDINLGDPTVSGLLNQAFKSGNISVFNPMALGGTKMDNTRRGVGDYQLDNGLFSSTNPVTIQNLMQATGAKTPTELFDKVTVLPSTSGNMRFKVTLKDTGPDGKAIGSSAWSNHQIEGLPQSREMTFEIQGTSANQQIVQRLGQDSNPAVKKLAYQMMSPDNANFLDKFSSTVKPTQAGADAWGTANEFGYGPATYSVTKSGDGRVKATVIIDGKSTTQSWTDEHTAEMELMDLHTNLMNNKDATIRYMIDAGTLK